MCWITSCLRAKTFINSTFYGSVTMATICAKNEFSLNHIMNGFCEDGKEAFRFNFGKQMLCETVLRLLTFDGSERTAGNNIETAVLYYLSCSTV